MSGVSFLWTLQKWVCRTNLAHHQTVDSLSLFHRYYFVRCLYELLKLAQLPYSHGRPICYSDRLHDFSVTIPRCYKNLYISSFWAGVIFNFMLDKLLKQMEVIWLYHSKCWETSICCYSGRPSYSDRLHDFSVTIPRC